jgi:DNA-directed RNA polymerase subunit RPC12/RpoP
MQLTCPACGLTFETEATTNTRCRRCRKVINIGARGRPEASTDAGDNIVGFSGPTLIGGVLVAGGVAALWHGVALRTPLDAATDVSEGQAKAWLWWCAFGTVLVVVGVLVASGR